MSIYQSYLHLTLECQRVGDEVKGKLKDELHDCEYTRLHVISGDVPRDTFNNLHEPDKEFKFSAEHVRLLETGEAGLLLKVCDKNNGVEFDFGGSGIDLLKKEDTFQIRLLKL